MMTNYLAAGPLIMDRVRAKVHGVKAVLAARDLAALNESTLQSPSVFVTYEGDRLGDSAGRGAARIVYQRWRVVLALRHARQSDGGAALRDAAGELLAELIDALQGWQPDIDFHPLRRVQSPAPGHSPAFGYYPMDFEAPLINVTA